MRLALTPTSLRRCRILFFCSIGFLTLLVGCSGASLKDDISTSLPGYALPPAQEGLLAELGRELQARHGEATSGFRILDDSRSSLYWRLALIDSAVSSLDIQTYLWYPDASGNLLLERAVLAAQRGVRVRLIVDDLLLQGHDQLIANLEAQPNIEFRIFNPWTDRGSLVERAAQLLVEMERLNTRMHDKLLIVDGRAVIIGGRNIGDHYFGLNDVYNFHDTDLLGLGHIAEQAGGMFDSFWNSDWVVSAQNLTVSPDPEVAREQWQAVRDSSANAPQLAQFPRQPRDWSQEMRAQAAQLRIGTSELIYDTTATDSIDQTLISSMFNLFGRARRELLVMNAYIIPSRRAIEFMSELDQRGVDVRMLTNSLASHDVPAVNSHYEPWRDELIGAGVDLYEFRAHPAIQSSVIDVPPAQAEFSGLHSKTAVVDRRYVFVGSMNLDPRSAKINTEMGAIVDSPGLAEDMAAVIERDMSGENAWHVTLDDSGDLQWRNSEETRDSQPARDGLQRVMNVIMKLGPRDQY
ncbi:phospholipase D family protein [Aestuariicella hydrocarbonica]|uniref:Phospholipase D family protein n=1 Tax=Pseudomaricurvus hydrocarbonicus TaxID=1470433 RepID=A0A9E5JRD9_9GAMM|nr:phospholipase D family protein [Aestuariicella hydrocarbonica]NHO63949.1 phospholipase D family protein [Aestuariicella hydrocarbonica]